MTGPAPCRALKKLKTPTPDGDSTPKCLRSTMSTTDRTEACDVLGPVEYYTVVKNRPKAPATTGLVLGHVVATEVTSRGVTGCCQLWESAVSDTRPSLKEIADARLDKVVFAACELGVFDLLATAPGPLDVGTVCTRLGTSFHGTELLLDACVALKLLTAETRTGKAVYGNTELSGAYLTSLSPTSQVHMLLYLARTTYRCWGHLAEAVREGKNQYEKAFAVPSGDLFTAIYRSEGERLLFMRGLQEVWSVSGSRVLAAFDLSRFPHICDLGGGSGALARVCASLYPAAKVTVFDTPEVVGTAETHFPAPTEGQLVFQAGEAAWETRFRGGSSAPGAVQGACGDPRGFSAVSSALWFLSPRKVCDYQYRALLASAGFGGFQLKRTGGPYDAMLARK
ncbi:acetylserotonin O-methyltransferase [Fukomys damarensis]|uniref:acetylserotonin O-methyltransferase n=1 Tax=Fukomys damarensis TaxID=885580 RepID=UPI001455D075|nr:acetylserotonin O-methyltransferase [Fukomys damarensis]